MPPISLSLTLEETNTVLEALGQMPYARVYLLVQKIQQQGTEHLHVEKEQGQQNGKQVGSVGNKGTSGDSGGQA